MSNGREGQSQPDFSYETLRKELDKIYSDAAREVTAELQKQLSPSDRAELGEQAFMKSVEKESLRLYKERAKPLLNTLKEWLPADLKNDLTEKNIDQLKEKYDCVVRLNQDKGIQGELKEQCKQVKQAARQLASELAKQQEVTMEPTQFNKLKDMVSDVASKAGSRLWGSGSAEYKSAQEHMKKIEKSAGLDITSSKTHKPGKSG